MDSWATLMELLMNTLPEFMPRQSFGDVVDKMTILSRKIYFGEEDAIEELSYLKGALNLPESKLGDLLVATIRLAQMNFEIWNLENEIRRGDKSLSVEEVGLRALKIRDFNRKRVRYKNLINRITGIGFVEFKIQHRSQ